MNQDRLLELLRQPTAPFREHLVRQYLERVLTQYSVPHFRDPVGNIVVGVNSREKYLKKLRSSSRPVLLFMAHMDHPGFHGVRWQAPDQLSIRWLGGSPKAFLEGASVWVADDSGFRGTGILENVNVGQGFGFESAIVRFEGLLQSKNRNAKVLFGGFQFREPVWVEGDVVYTKAADDLVGSFVVSELAIQIFNKPSWKPLQKNFLGLLTRAEEVGFIGAISHFELGWWKRSSLRVVSLETSRALPGADFGKGPVVRLGDKATVFSPSSIHVLEGLARKHLKDRYQKRIMDGGTCEATVAVAYGCEAMGISIPLGNYHNQSFQGGPDSRGPDGPAPEFVDSSDIQGMLDLCRALLQKGIDWKDPWVSKRMQFRKWVQEYRSLLTL